MIKERRKVASMIAEKRHAALADAKARKDALYKACPELAELDKEMARLSYEHARASILGEEKKGDYETEMAALIARKKEKIGNVDIEPHFACAVCEDTGHTKDGDCKCFTNLLIKENLASANLSVSAADETFENFDMRYYDKAVDPAYGSSPYAVMEWVRDTCERFATEFDKPSKSLLLAGKPGLGKTFLSSAIAAKVLESGHTVLYISAAEFAARASANKFGELSEEMQIFYDVDLLILDDLGTEFKTSVTLSAFGDILDRRLRNGKKMVFSTNLTLGELDEFYGARVASRLSGFFAYLLLIGSDIRRMK